eukprot:8210593-Pyramimonas_sp.AAC.1
MPLVIVEALGDDVVMVRIHSGLGINPGYPRRNVSVVVVAHLVTWLAFLAVLRDVAARPRAARWRRWTGVVAGSDACVQVVQCLQLLRPGSAPRADGD